MLIAYLLQLKIISLLRIPFEIAHSDWTIRIEVMGDSVTSQPIIEI